MRDRQYLASVEFLERLFSDTTQAIELRVCANDRGAGGSRPLFTRDPKEIEVFCRREDRDGFGVYFGCCTRRAGSTSGNQKTVMECPALWVDIDCAKQGIAGDDALAALEFLPHPPTMIVDSGAGLHAYWLLEAAIDVSLPEGGGDNPARERIVQCLKALALVLAGDSSCAELARILRLPGTMNSKPATLALGGGQPITCTVLSDTGHVHDFDELCAWLGDQRAVLQGKVEAAHPVREDDPFVAYAREAGYEPAIDIDNELGAMSHGASGKQSIHATQLRVSASMIARGYEDDEIVERILRATEAAAPGDARWNWSQEEGAIRKMVATGRAKGYEKLSAAPKKTRGAAMENPATVGNLAVVHDIAEEREKRAKPDPDKEKISTTVMLGEASLGVWRERHGPLMHCQGTTYSYEGGIWIEWDERLAQQLRAIVQEACSVLKIEPKTALLNAIKAYVMDRPELQRRNILFDQKKIVVAADACLDLETFEITPHSPDNFATRKVAATLGGDRSHRCIDEMMRGAFADKDDALGIIITLQEWFGAAIVPREMKTRDMKKGLILHGPSRSGKTQISELARHLLGKEYVSGARMSDLEDRFGREPLIGKRGWIADDAIGEAEYLDAETYKVVVTGERTSAKRKGGKNWDGSFGIPVLLTANNMPRVRDQSAATFNRSLILHMTNVVPEGTPEPFGYESISDKIGKTELTGLLWWALDGWKRLVARGAFDPPEIMRLAVQSFQDDNNQVGAWFKQCVARNSLYRVARADLVASFQGWLMIEHDSTREWKPNTITRRLRDLVAGAEEPTVNGIRYIAGIELNEEGLAGWERWKNSRFGENIGTVSSVSEVNKVHPANESIKRDSSLKKTMF